MEENILTKKERKLLKRQEKENERLRLAQRKKTKKIIAIGLPLISIIGGIVFGLMSYSPAKTQGAPKMEINPLEYDAGDISMANGPINYTYEIKNTGDGDLKIKDIKTSCDCTSAVLRVGEIKSPTFSMHTDSSFWSSKITAGETGFLEVVFDPAFHGPEGTGQAIRVVSFSTNDPRNEKAEVRLTANVAP
ncbi:MAG: hypothetical protein A3A94_03145 [Candidatus Portnoybacteria bacterium RIFCSPLOWO2_01_FULL_43_11]|uniref:DUF1573 domain-containing protein n=3 Tax=Candidatus Portnoyibacteriota TaxID=1817913 RepID=A0A1G2F9W0_9BACT|nr:MAG: hypothetical protein A2815_02800 [Candidatus Portnoybacteria bacterium RIFCSPHIGHO2_01_FULL_40_12b]OGZ36843.1 MAG: hypothetical protein A3D38_01810 [Candidatus Portnoybacteria bacterium RIFCSPHIGHO2_02_FULL_40_23]OGZ38249.1 MAG: hypothetical protein A3A94_03145 [Candidatus Portnoybacteria bacterium RIFCSPLOWO2_01_FULL_43_11]OGZ39223.1 MAG: hypothetical protein A3E90_03080 [Candidatus Portnoybacteria bacterium RIFCSPHIGHO2_12_FULL_40_11]